MADTAGTTGAGADGFDFRAIHERVSSLLEKQIFFVGGVVKSGTSWVQHLLNLHPQVSCGGESHFIDSLFPKLKQALEEHNQRMLDRAQNAFRYEIGDPPPVYASDELLYVLATAMLALMRKEVRSRSVLAVGEKTPANLVAFALLGTLIPRSKCIQVIRDPRDAVVSAWHYNQRMNPVEASRLGSTLSEFVTVFADQWVRGVGVGLQFGTRHPGRYHELRYEDLVERPVPTLAGAFRFLGVDDGEAVVRGAIEAASFERLSGGRARGEEDPGSFFRKGAVGDWKHHLDAQSVDYVLEKCGAPMQRFGYL